jgi:hypothetical protein
VLGLGLGKEREGERARGGKRSLATVAHAGEGEGKGELGWAKGMGCSFFSFSSFLSSFPNSIYSPKHHLNSNKFEFKPYNSTQIK